MMLPYKRSFVGALLFVLLVCRTRQLFAEMTFAVAMPLGMIAVFAQHSRDVFPIGEIIRHRCAGNQLLEEKSAGQQEKQ